MKNVEKILAIASFVIALIAIGISLKSCDISQRALEITESDFMGSRTLVLIASYMKNNETIKWAPVDDQITLQSMRIIFPPILNVNPWPVLPPQWELPTPVLTNSLRNSVLKEIKRPPKDQSLVGLNRMLPIIVEAAYIAKGQVINVRSCYNILFDLSISDRDFVPPQIDYRGSVLVAHTPNLEPSFLNSMWKEQLSTMKEK